MQILFPSFGYEVLEMLNINGIPYSVDGNAILFPEHSLKLILVPLKEKTVIPRADECELFYLYEDRWMAARRVTSLRILAKLGKFRRIHARLCRVISEENCKDAGLSSQAFHTRVSKFLEAYHTYGYLKNQLDYLLVYKGDTVAAAQFMQTYRPRLKSRLRKITGEICSSEDVGFDGVTPTQGRCSFEWTRYASLPDVRIAGGMGKLLGHFADDVAKKFREESDSSKPVYGQNGSESQAFFEIMSYSDNEWGSGDVYRKLGFEESGQLSPVTYHVHPVTFKRLSQRQMEALLKKTSAFQSEALQSEASRTETPQAEALQSEASRTEAPQSEIPDNYVEICNRGSIKWLRHFPL